MPNGVALTDVKHHRTNGKTERDRLAEGERMLVDRAHGMTQSALAEKYGLSVSTVALRLEHALQSRLATTVDAYREQQNASLDHLSQRQADALTLVERAIGDALSRGELGNALSLLDRLERTTVTMVRLMERRAKLNGLDKPVEVDVTVHEVTQQDQELAQMIRESRARVSASVKDHLREPG